MASTTGKNRSILAGLVAPVTETPTVERGAPATERLSTRLTGLARVTSGDVKEKTLKLVDPARCRMWSGHNRRYDLLNEASCADLLESFKRQPQSLVMPEIPAGSFAKKLYSTYLSYLPREAISFPLKMNVDPRSRFNKLLMTTSCSQFSVNISHPGITKGL